MGLRLAASLLLCLAVIAQAGYSRPRLPRHKQKPVSSCTISLNGMESVLELALSGDGLITKGDKAFLHLQHLRLGCLEYTDLFENSDFYPDPKTRAALANWHWTVYHSKDEKVREAAIHQIQAGLQAPK